MTVISGWRQFWSHGGFWRAVLLAAVYLALYLGAGHLISSIWADQIDTADVVRSATSVFFALVLPIVVGIVLLYAFAASLGWTRILFARQPIGGPWWMWILPLVVLIYNIIRFAAVDYSRYTVGTVIMVLFLGLCVGVAEETLTRGFAVDLLRHGGYRELAVAVLSSLIFALSHATNLFSGQAVITVALTVVYTFAFGIAMYFTLRVTRNLVWPILLHASTDPSGLLLAGGIDQGGGSSGGLLATIAGTSNWAVIVLAMILVWFTPGRVLVADQSIAPETTD
jgi:membrane protease YdiL (CAAX protease family)